MWWQQKKVTENKNSCQDMCDLMMVWHLIGQAIILFNDDPAIGVVGGGVVGWGGVGVGGVGLGLGLGLGVGGGGCGGVGGWTQML